MNIRPFEDAEQEKIKNFIAWILEKELDFKLSKLHDQDLDDLKKAYQQERCVMLVAEENGQLIGTIAVKEENKESALIRRLFIHPAYRHRGFGSVLIDRAMDFCHLHGYKKVTFRVISKMSSAVSLFIKHGFKETERAVLEDYEIIILSHALT